MSLAVFVETDRKTERQRERHERDMEAARYRLYHGLTCEEVGKIIGCNRKMAHRRIRRAIESGDPRIAEWQARWDG